VKPSQTRQLHRKEFTLDNGEGIGRGAEFGDQLTITVAQQCLGPRSADRGAMEERGVEVGS